MMNMKIYKLNNNIYIQTCWKYINEIKNKNILNKYRFKNIEP